MSLDEEEARMLRRILDDVLTDPRFITQSSVSALQIAEHVWRRAALGHRDFATIKQSTLTLLDAR
jgi:hypothetical protein